MAPSESNHLKHVTECNGCRVKFTLEEFRELEYVGEMQVPGCPDLPGEEDAIDLEMRNHTCGSTISVDRNKL